jgi:hypothetical protein
VQVEFFIVMDWDKDKEGNSLVRVLGSQKTARHVYRARIVRADKIQDVFKDYYKDRGLVGWKRRSTAERALGRLQHNYQSLNPRVVELRF